MTKFSSHILFFIAIGILGSSKKNQSSFIAANIVSEKSIELKGSLSCPLEKIEYSQDSIALNFDESICTLFENELDTLGDTIHWFMSWKKMENEYWPISSFIQVSHQEKVVYKRQMSFKTWPSISDEEEFKKSIYYKLATLKPTLVLNDSIDTIKNIEVLLTIK